MITLTVPIMNIASHRIHVNCMPTDKFAALPRTTPATTDLLLCFKALSACASVPLYPQCHNRNLQLRTGQVDYVLIDGRPPSHHPKRQYNTQKLLYSRAHTCHTHATYTCVSTRERVCVNVSVNVCVCAHAR